MACFCFSSSCKALSLSFLHWLNKHHCKPTAGPWSCVPSHLEAAKRRWASEASQRSSYKRHGESHPGPGVRNGNSGRQTPCHLEKAGFNQEALTAERWGLDYSDTGFQRKGRAMEQSEQDWAERRMPSWAEVKLLSNPRESDPCHAQKRGHSSLLGWASCSSTPGWLRALRVTWPVQHTN